MRNAHTYIISAKHDRYDNYFRFPGAVFDRFTDTVGWAYEELNAIDELYIVEPGLLFPSEDAFSGSLVIRLDDGFTIEIPPEEMSHPLRGIDRTGKRVLQSNLTETAVFRSTDVLGRMAFGKVFLSQVSQTRVETSSNANRKYRYTWP